MQTRANLRVLTVLLSLGQFLGTVRNAAAADPPIPEQVKQWMEQCRKGYEQGQYVPVMPICQKSVDTLETSLPQHPRFAEALNDLGMYYQALGQYKQAETIYRRSLQIREQVQGREHRDVAETINNLATVFRAYGRPTEALPLFLRSLQIWERTLGPNDPLVGSALNNIADTYRVQYRYDKAEQYFLRSLRIFERSLGLYHPNVAICMNNIAELYGEMGKDSEAEEYLMRSLHIRERELGPEHPHFADSLHNLAALYLRQGNFRQAELFFLRSLRIREKALGLEHPLVAASLGNISLVYQEQGNYSYAETFSVRNLQMREKLLGSEHPDVATALDNIARLYYAQGKYDQAESLFLRGLHIREKALDPAHPLLAKSLHHLAILYLSQGNHAQAEPLLLRSLDIREKALGLQHPEVANVLYSQALLELARRQDESALSRLDHALRIREQTLKTSVTEARVTSLLDTIRDEEDKLYSLLLLHDAPVQVRSLALRMSLLRKGRSAEAGLISGWALHAGLSTEEQHSRFADWQALRNQYERLLLRGPSKFDNVALQKHRDRLTELTNQIESQEHELARSLPMLQRWKLPFPDEIISQVANRLAANTALVDVLRIKPYLFQGTGMDVKRWGPPRYVALTLFSDRRIDMVDLGDAEVIDRIAQELLIAVRDLRQEPLPQAQALYQKVMAPLLAKLNGVQRIYLSLDGRLNLVPFAALHDGSRYVVDAPYQIQYLGSGRDLLRGALGQPQQPALVMADPDFGSKQMGHSQAEARIADVRTRSLYESLGSLSQLPGARVEGTSISNLMQVRPLLGAEATEVRLRQARSPLLLHIATHGLFLDRVQAETGGARSALLVAAPPPPAAKSDAAIAGLMQNKEQTLLSQSALILAGAAHAAEAPDVESDGLLTANEARSLSLFGTQLVVLSACDTGRGTVKAGQGVYGLRRAFLVAGAQTVVMSLWPVSDVGTQSLMQRYYQLLLDKKQPRGRISGLLEAMRAVKAERPHPYYWAPFIANGLDAPLQPAPSSAGPR